MKKIYILSLDTDEDMKITFEHSDEKEINAFVKYIQESLPGSCLLCEDDGEYDFWQFYSKKCPECGENLEIMDNFGECYCTVCDWMGYPDMKDD